MSCRYCGIIGGERRENATREASVRCETKGRRIRVLASRQLRGLYAEATSSRSYFPRPHDVAYPGGLGLRRCRSRHRNVTPALAVRSRDASRSGAKRRYHRRTRVSAWGLKRALVWPILSFLSFRLSPLRFGSALQSVASLCSLICKRVGSPRVDKPRGGVHIMSFYMTG
jgi:hypothetical protein